MPCKLNWMQLIKYMCCNKRQKRFQIYNRPHHQTQANNGGKLGTYPECLTTLQSRSETSIKLESLISNLLLVKIHIQHRSYLEVGEIQFQKLQ